MKRNTLRWIIGLMGVAMIGLLSFQLYWIQTMHSENENRFKKDVIESLNAVADKLEKQETLAAYQKLNYINSSRYANEERNARRPIGPEVNQARVNEFVLSDTFKLGGGGQFIVEFSSTTGSYFFNEEAFKPPTINEQLAKKDNQIYELENQLNKISRKYKQALNVVNNHLMAPGRSITSRFNPLQLDSLLQNELLNRGIDIQFNYGVVAPRLNRFVLINKLDEKEKLEKSELKASLFPNDLSGDLSFIVVHFPKKKNYLLNKVWSASISSGILILVILFCFGYSIKTIMHQKKLSEMKNDFINNMTHELKTPISTVSLAVEALSDKGIANSSLKDKYLGVIHDENKRLYAQVEKVLQIAAIDRKDYNLKYELLRMNDVAREAASHLAMQIESRGGRINLIEGATQDTVKGDPMHLSNIILNLLDNANKYSPESPNITVRTASDTSYFKISIQDKGLGMTKEQIKHIFEKFYRVPTGNLHNVKGFGLGLSYVQQMVKAHGGYIQVKSEPGKGSNFSITLPLEHE